jgi:hypothetical protein
VARRNRAHPGQRRGSSEVDQLHPFDTHRNGGRVNRALRSACGTRFAFADCLGELRLDVPHTSVINETDTQAAGGGGASEFKSRAGREGNSCRKGASADGNFARAFVEACALPEQRAVCQPR